LSDQKNDTPHTAAVRPYLANQPPFNISDRDADATDIVKVESPYKPAVTVVSCRSASEANAIGERLWNRIGAETGREAFGNATNK
jgi:hypothetical protein